jgi:hypothetical protein
LGAKRCFPDRASRRPCILEIRTADRGRGHRLGAAVATGAHDDGGQVLAPAGDLAWGDRRDAVVAEACLEPGLEALQVPADLGLDLGRADATNAKVELALHPHRQAVVTAAGHVGDPEHLS